MKILRSQLEPGKRYHPFLQGRIGYGVVIVEIIEGERVYFFIPVGETEKIKINILPMIEFIEVKSE